MSSFFIYLLLLCALYSSFGWFYILVIEGFCFAIRILDIGILGQL